MALDLTGLTNYTKENEMALISKAISGGKTASMMRVQPKIKTTAKINILETDAVFQDGSDCGFTASGTTAITQRTITVGSIKVNEALCPKKLEAKYLQEQLTPGSNPEEVPFEELYANQKVAKIIKQLAKGIWMGDTASGDASLARFDGLAKIIKAATTEIIATPQADVTSATIRGIIENIYSLVPADILDSEDLRLFMGWDNFRTLLAKLTADNLFHYTTDEAAKTGEMYYPGTTLKIVADHGLNGSDEMYCLLTSNMFRGTDLEGEEEKFSIAYAPEAQEVRYEANFKFGVQVAFPDQIVRYQNS